MKKLTREIKKYVKGINDTERNKLGELSNGKFLVASTVLKIIKDHKSQPPTVRPMSELPEVNVFVNVLIEHETKFWGDGFICLNRVELRYLGQDLWKQQDYKSDIGVKALGWLPKEELPNPNDIKL